MKLLTFDDLAGHEDWQRLWAADPLQHANYTVTGLAAGSRHYTRLYYLPAEHDVSRYRASAEVFLPRHALVMGPDGPVAGTPVTVEVLDGRTRLSAYGRPLYLVQDPAAPPRARKRAAELIYRHLQEVAAAHDAERWHLRDHLTDGAISPLTEVVLRNGGVSRHHLTQMVDLTLPEEERRAELRKNFQRILRKPPARLDLAVVTGAEVTPDDLEQFARLQLAFYGKGMRSQESWDAIRASVLADEAFLVIGRRDGRVVTIAYFAVSPGYCLYVSGVNERGGAGDGLSHHVLWRAMRHAERLGCRYFELGEVLHPGDHPDLDEKFLSIGHFKAGFSNMTVLRLDVFSAPLGRG
ncbi:hypothetical protein Ssi03_13890 [Sphaerisporangium siamense]|uniref:BioF2-like acetyltransferase domain-containing protein n=1 Tax=Sphaerisporangium siamense TaxID=795645 RepID=A0A7W7DA89_9ACTN|nr:GNAT family N-acetyltransferase [Sphaerisporangium siamense]MBB4702844.1 hypothetical protein [Sphaerisporangium siamense]GII83399.1 hypothetical protein Ssi03_13890 [Sphaerisporangium siamense]